MADTESPVKTLRCFGQSPWLDFIQRSLVREGELAAMMQRWGLRGVTSNPAIFERAIDHSSEYDGAIAALANAGSSSKEILERLALDDVSAAADLFRPLYEETQGEDGFVSLEVSPHLAHHTQGTVAEARRLWRALGRPNVMIKVPATPAGLPALRTLLADGVNVNVTLLFGLERYREVADAYLSGLEGAASAGRPLERIASVASFFLSRIDSMLDPLLEKVIAEGGTRGRRAAALRGEIAIASARRAYAIFQQVFESPRFGRLGERGARPQRLLWASTSTKNADYSDVKYVEPLIGPHTVNTMPLDTLEAYHDHGRPAARLEEDPEGAARKLAALAEIGMNLSDVTERLLAEGVAKFIQPYDALLMQIERKRSAARGAASATEACRG